MGLTMEVDFAADCYEATLGRDEPEWPPHPARAFCALVSVAEPGSPDDDALRWLEGQDAPLVLAPALVGQSVRNGFVPTNVTTVKGGHQVYAGRTSGSRSWARAVPSERLVRIVWPQAQPDSGTVEALDSLGRRVAYLGRSTTPVTVAFTVADPAGADLRVYRPQPTGHVRLRVPYRGYLEQLRYAHADGAPAWSVARSIAYSDDSRAVVDRESRQDESPPPYSDLLIFGFEPGQGVDGHHAPAVSRAFKAAVLQRLGRGEPGLWPPFDEAALALVHGHNHGGRRQCAFLALPFVDRRNPHASGQVLGVALAVSPDLDRTLRLALLRLAGLDRLDGPRLARLRVPRLGRTLQLQPPDERQTLRASRWQAAASTWTTVLPIVLDWFPKRRLPAEEVVARGCEAAGLPRPARVELLAAPLYSGSPHIPRRAMASRSDRALPPAVHALIDFDRAVGGPVVVGHLRHLGLGLCLRWDNR